MKHAADILYKLNTLHTGFFSFHFLLWLPGEQVAADMMAAKVPGGWLFLFTNRLAVPSAGMKFTAGRQRRRIRHQPFNRC